MATSPADAPPERHVSPLLATAIVASPVIFYWLLLRRGYARSTRRVALVFTIVMMLPGIIVMAIGG